MVGISYLSVTAGVILILIINGNTGSWALPSLIMKSHFCTRAEVMTPFLDCVEIDVRTSSQRTSCSMMNVQVGTRYSICQYHRYREDTVFSIFYRWKYE